MRLWKKQQERPTGGLNSNSRVSTVLITPRLTFRRRNCCIMGHRSRTDSSITRPLRGRALRSTLPMLLWSALKANVDSSRLSTDIHTLGKPVTCDKAEPPAALLCYSPKCAVTETSQTCNGHIKHRGTLKGDILVKDSVVTVKFNK